MASLKWVLLKIAVRTMSLRQSTNVSMSVGRTRLASTVDFDLMREYLSDCSLFGEMRG
jgi:hypothetical protein